MLHLLVCARMAQSVTMSAYSFAHNPANAYLLTTSRPGWALLTALLALSESSIAAFNGTD